MIRLSGICAALQAADEEHGIRTMADRAAMEALARSLSSHAQILAQHNALTRAALPQTYSGPQIRARYPGVGEATVLAHIAHLTGRVGERGHRIALTLDEVLALDERIRWHVQGAA